MNFRYLGGINKWGILVVGVVIITIWQAEVFFGNENEPEPADSTNSPQATLLISPSPTPSPTPTQTQIVATRTPTPKPVDARLEYVKTQALAAGLDAAAVNAITTSQRLFLYPIQSVAPKPVDWAAIEAKLTSEQSLQKGRDYIATNATVFAKAETDFGVNKEALAGLIAIETDFGKNTGNYIIFNALYSRMKQWPATTWQSQANQIVALLRYCLEEKFDCYSIKGSYAGAFGIVQFLPSSLLAYGIDGNADGFIDLFNSIDAVPSAANFLKKHGWDSDQLQALARYYGSPIGYPEIVLKYAQLLRQ